MAHLNGGLQMREHYLDSDITNLECSYVSSAKEDLQLKHLQYDMEINMTSAREVQNYKQIGEYALNSKDTLKQNCLNRRRLPLHHKRLLMNNIISKPDVTFPTIAAVMFLVILLSCPKYLEGYVLQGSEQTSRPNMPPLSISCYRHFGHKVEACVEPFKSLLDLYEAKVYTLPEPVAVAKHICLEYQMVLLCLHSALTDCPTEKNLKRVQTTLDSHWVGRMNGLCSIQSKSSTQIEREDYNDLTNYIYKNNFPNHVDSSQIADEILQASIKTRARLGEEIISAKTEDKFGATLPETRRRLSPTLQREMDYLDHRTKEDGAQGGTNLQLSIMNFINNYYDANYKPDRTKPVKTRFVSAKYDLNKSGANRVSVSFSLILGIVCSLWISWHR